HGRGGWRWRKTGVAQMQELAKRIAAALEMVDAFVSVQSRRFDLTITNLKQEKVRYSPGRSLGAMRLLVPSLIPVSWELHQNLIIRPEKPPYGVLAQLDDLDVVRLERASPAAFLIVETSPGNYQAWVSIEGGNDDMIRRIVRDLRVDWNASRAVRIAGSPN